MKKLVILLVLAAALILEMSNVQARRMAEEKMTQVQAYQFSQLGDLYVVRINPGQPLIASLQDFCQKQNITLAELSGVGSLKSATLGFFDPQSKQFVQKTFNQPLEMASLIGNVVLQDGKPLIHPHTVVAGADYQALAGHMVEAEVSFTAEIFIRKIDGQIVKAFDPVSGLNLMQFPR